LCDTIGTLALDVDMRAEVIMLTWTVVIQGHAGPDVNRDNECAVHTMVSKAAHQVRTKSAELRHSW
jgi:hypothetical protein